MSLEQTFAEYFKPEVQKRGREDFLKGLAFVTGSSDIHIEGLVRGMPPLRVTFHADSIASPIFKATCTCSTAIRGGFCKHMWTLLLTVEKKHPDFLSSKTSIEKNDRRTEKPKPQNRSPEAEARAAQFKEKQSQFKKQQYEKQKVWAKEMRRQKKAKIQQSEEPRARERYPGDVEAALEFFTKNGFAMEDLPSAETLKLARKHLSRVFHPDRGGTHEEATALGNHYETLSRFMTMIR